MSNEITKTGTCDYCGEEFQKSKHAPNKRFCKALCRVQWNYHNNEKYRESCITGMMDRYYSDREGFIERQKTYKKRDGWEGNLKSKQGKTRRRENYVEVAPLKREIEEKEFGDRFDFGSIDFGFDFKPFRPNEEGDGV